ncbi:MAG TPA: hypothetical protein VFQ53_00050 [Kofleriaceae bacterium]|nr:hypothetical protein [Kofleriaceae bacterium]
MPQYDQLIGCRLDTSAVSPDDRPRAEEQFALATSNDSDLAVGDRQRELEALRQIPGVRAELVLEHEEGGRYLVIFDHAREVTAEIRDSRRPDRVEPPRGELLATAPLKDGAIDDALAALREATEDVDGSDDELELPRHFRDRDAMLAALAKLGPCLRGRVAALVEIDGRRYDVELADRQVRCTPLHALCASPEHTRRVAELAGLAVVDEPTVIPYAAPPKKPRPPKFDPERPLLTGSSRARLDAFHQLTDWRKPPPDDVTIFIEAARAPANRDKAFAELRRELYRLLAKYDRPEVVELFTWALREEDDELANTVTYVGWRLESLIAQLPALREQATSAGDQRFAARIRRLQSEAR